MYSSVLSDEGDYSDFGSDTSEDDDVTNVRVAPLWDIYRHLFEQCGYHLDTCWDVKLFYLRYWESQNPQTALTASPGYSLAMRGEENELCKDVGLPERLFRGRRISDGMNIVVKAVHRQSRELDIIRTLSTPPLRDCEMNHCIPVLDLIEPPGDYLTFIIMEEWSSHLIPDIPRTLRMFLTAMRQCIEHIAFMHAHCIAHLDISLRNVLTDYEGNYACIDFECSWRFESATSATTPLRICQLRGGELPPEAERMEQTDPYKSDVWALGILIRRACQATGYHIDELWDLTTLMLHPCFEHRPSVDAVLKQFNQLVEIIEGPRLDGPPTTFV